MLSLKEDGRYTFLLILILVLSIIIIMLALASLPINEDPEWSYYIQYALNNLVSPLAVSLVVLLIAFRINYKFNKRIDFNINNIPIKTIDVLERKRTSYFTGIVNKYYLTGIFTNVKIDKAIRVDPEEIKFITGSARHRLETKALFIGLKEESLPDDLIESISEDIEQKIGIVKYKILITYSNIVSLTRTKSTLDDRYSGVVGYTEGNLDGLKKFLDRLVQRFDDAEKEHVVEDILNERTCVRLREHSTYPFGVMLAYEGSMWYTPLWNHSSASKDGPIMEIVRNSGVGKQLEKSFDDIWSAARSIDIDSIESTLEDIKSGEVVICGECGSEHRDALPT